MSTFKLRPIATIMALTFAGALIPAYADSADKKEIAALKAQLKALQEQVQALATATAKAKEAAPAPVIVSAPAAPVVASDEPSMDTRVSKMELQMEQLTTTASDGPLAGLSVSGYVDLGYFANHNAKSNSFSFGRAQDTVYSADNSSTGDIYLDIKKTFGSGNTAPSAELVLAPNRGYGAGTTGGKNIIHTAQVTIPTSPTSSYFFGQIGSWAGYDYYQSNLTNTVTHNLLYDFADPAYFTGAGYTYTDGAAAWKFMLGNANAKTFNDSVRTPTFEYRLDYTWDSKTNIGWSGYFGKTSVNNRQDAPADFNSSIAYTEVDLGYTLFETTINAQLDYGRQQKAAWNGGDATWWGASLLGNYKFSDIVSGTLRADYLDNSKNGGGMPAIYGLAASATPGTDTVNGFGIDPACYASAQAADATDFGYSCKGAKRTSLTAALLYYPIKQVVLKAEFRYDHANMPVFQKKDATATNNNSLIGLQAVYGF